MKRALPAVALLALLAACGGGSDDGSSSSSDDASTSTEAASIEDLVKHVESEISDVSATTIYTEDNDPNDLIGRPSGYTAAASLRDDRADQCIPSPETDNLEIGVDCGAVIEVWPSDEDAKARADKIQSLLKDTGVLGSEYAYLNGSRLLRVDGSIKPSAAKKYEAAWKDAPE